MSEVPIEFFPDLSALPGIRHGFSLRVPGLDVRTDRQSALARLEDYHAEARAEFGPRRFYTAEQIHGGRVAVVGRDSGPEAQGVDGLITQDPAGLLGIYVADCCAIFLVDTQRPAVGLVHSGRKGTELNIAGATVCHMSERFGTDPADLVVQLSPCIRPPYYEVDFAAEIQRQLYAAGVKKVSDTGENTGADLQRFYSYRMEKGRTGRMLALLALARSTVAG